MSTARKDEFGEAEFHILCDRLGIDSGVTVSPRLGFVVDAARSTCRVCDAKAQCRLALGIDRVAVADVAAFCPNTERLTYLQCVGVGLKKD